MEDIALTLYDVVEEFILNNIIKFKIYTRSIVNNHRNKLKAKIKIANLVIVLYSRTSIKLSAVFEAKMWYWYAQLI